jgi:hypothetical protein
MCATTPVSVVAVLAEAEWRERQRAHEMRVRAWTDPHQARVARGEKHPIYDFLFSYYAFRPAWLRRWHPGPDVLLAGAGSADFLRWAEYRTAQASENGETPGVFLDCVTLEPKRREFVRWLLDLLRRMSERPPFFGCHGLHEWAMVYRQGADELRHQAYPLRHSPDQLAAIVERSAICCSHFDAFRFFTTPARSLNRLQPSRPEAAEFEQRGCLHANMDLYKWAFKLSPFTPSELVADCFELARDIREIDMRASPYDLRAIGFEPIPIETPEGRADYERHQRCFTARGEPLRERLIELCARLNPTPEPRTHQPAQMI